MAETKVTVNFKGICTHLTAMYDHPVAQKFSLSAGKTPIEHRIFLANSALIDSRIDPDRCVVPHVPKLRILKALPDGGDYELVLQNVALRFEGVAEIPLDPITRYAALAKLPHMWDLNGGGLTLRDAVKSGWTHCASAYVDFTAGATFSVDSTTMESSATIEFTGEPTLVLRPCNSDDREDKRIALYDGDIIEISNRPADNTACSSSDYLLNYLATTLDISKSAPVWPDPSHAAALKSKGKGNTLGDVYCTSTTYP